MLNFNKDKENQEILEIFEAVEILSKSIPKDQLINIELEHDNEEDYYYFTINIDNYISEYDSIKDYVESIFNYMVLEHETKKNIANHFEPFTFHNNPKGIELLKQALMGPENNSFYNAQNLNNELNIHKVKKNKHKI